MAYCVLRLLSAIRLIASLYATQTMNNYPKEIIIEKPLWDFMEHCEVYSTASSSEKQAFEIHHALLLRKMIDENIKELIAIGASVSANCGPCIKHHVAKAREMEIDEEEIQQAIEVGKMVRKGAAGQMDKLISELASAKD